MKKRMRTSVVIVLVVPLFCFFNVFDVYAFKCGEDVISTGDSKARVLSRCGKPMLKEKIGGKKKHRRSKVDPEDRYEVKTSRGTEKWTYNCGDGDFMYALTFEKGIVVDIDTDGRGKGKSGCEGR